MERTMIHGERPAREDQRHGTGQTPGAPEVGLLSVNVGLPRVIGTSRWGKPIRSGVETVAGVHALASSWREALLARLERM